MLRNKTVIVKLCDYCELELNTGDLRVTLKYKAKSDKSICSDCVKSLKQELTKQLAEHKE